MNDRFNFRVWYKPENKYLDGIFAVARSGRLIIDLDILQDYDDKSSDCIIEQCTGLKDKNGNLIYEGDIVEDMWDDALFIKWRDGEARFAAEDDDVAHDLEDVVDGCEIIGNIHEQAEQKD